MKTIFYNGEIYTLNNNKDIFNTMIVNENGKIEFLGEKLNLEELENYKEVNLEGGIVYPGFIDSHLHMLNYAFIETNLKLFECVSIEEIQKKIIDFNKNNEDEWIFGRGWNQEKFEATNRLIEKKDLDILYKDIPIFLIRVCGHLAVANSKALEKILELEKSKDFLKYIDVEKGILLEGAVKLCYDAMPSFDHKKIEKLIKFAATDLNKCGITSVHSDNFLSLPGKNYKEIIKAFKNLDEREELTVRVCDQASFTNKKDLEIFLNDKDYSNVKSDFYKIGPIKIYQDGSLGAKTALLKDGYVGNEGEHGIAIHSFQNLKDMIEVSHKEGKQVIVHAIGDLALEQVLNAVEEVNVKYPQDDHRHGVVHAQVTNSELLERMAKNNIVAYVQPIFASSDMEIAKKLLGPKREKNSYAWKSMIDKKIVVTGSSDSPVESFNILENMQIAVTRKNLDDIDGEAWNSDEKLTKAECLDIFTKNSAYASFEENLKGTLEVGKVADFVVLNKDILKTKDMLIKNIEVLKTVVNGKVVYKK